MRDLNLNKNEDELKLSHFFQAVKQSGKSLEVYWDTLSEKQKEKWSEVIETELELDGVFDKIKIGNAPIGPNLHHIQSLRDALGYRQVFQSFEEGILLPSPGHIVEFGYRHAKNYEPISKAEGGRLCWEQELDNPSSLPRLLVRENPQEPDHTAAIPGRTNQSGQLRDPNNLAPVQQMGYVLNILDELNLQYEEYQLDPNNPLPRIQAALEKKDLKRLLHLINRCDSLSILNALSSMEMITLLMLIPNKSEGFLYQLALTTTSPGQFEYFLDKARTLLPEPVYYELIARQANSNASPLSKIVEQKFAGPNADRLINKLLTPTEREKKTAQARAVIDDRQNTHAAGVHISTDIGLANVFRRFAKKYKIDGARVTLKATERKIDLSAVKSNSLYKRKLEEHTWKSLTALSKEIDTYLALEDAIILEKLNEGLAAQNPNAPLYTDRNVLVFKKKLRVARDFMNLIMAGIPYGDHYRIDPLAANSIGLTLQQITAITYWGLKEGKGDGKEKQPGEDTRHFLRYIEHLKEIMRDYNNDPESDALENIEEKKYDGIHDNKCSGGTINHLTESLNNIAPDVCVSNITEEQIQAEISDLWHMYLLEKIKQPELKECLRSNYFNEAGQQKIIKDHYPQFKAWVAPKLRKIYANVILDPTCKKYLNDLRTLSSTITFGRSAHNQELIRNFQEACELTQLIKDMDPTTYLSFLQDGKVPYYFFDDKENLDTFIEHTVRPMSPKSALALLIQPHGNFDLLLRITVTALHFKGKEEEVQRYLDNYDKVHRWCLQEGEDLNPPDSLDNILSIVNGLDESTRLQWCSICLASLPENDLVRLVQFRNVFGFEILARALWEAGHSAQLIDIDPGCEQMYQMLNTLGSTKGTKLCFNYLLCGHNEIAHFLLDFKSEKMSFDDLNEEFELVGCIDPRPKKICLLALAIRKGDAEMVDTLLSLGAKTEWHRNWRAIDDELQDIPRWVQDDNQTKKNAIKAVLKKHGLLRKLCETALDQRDYDYFMTDQSEKLKLLSDILETRVKSSSGLSNKFDAIQNKYINRVLSSGIPNNQSDTSIDWDYLMNNLMRLGYKATTNVCITLMNKVNEDTLLKMIKGIDDSQEQRHFRRSLYAQLLENNKLECVQYLYNQRHEPNAFPLDLRGDFTMEKLKPETLEHLMKMGPEEGKYLTMTIQEGTGYLKYKIGEYEGTFQIAQLIKDNNWQLLRFFHQQGATHFRDPDNREYSPTLLMCAVRMKPKPEECEQYKVFLAELCLPRDQAASCFSCGLFPRRNDDLNPTNIALYYALQFYNKEAARFLHEQGANLPFREGTREFVTYTNRMNSFLTEPSAQRQNNPRRIV